MSVYLGIDPGKTGGLAWKWDGIGKMEALKMPDTERDIFNLFEQIAQSTSGEAYAIIEAVHAFPGQGVTSSFTFGRGYGFLRGCLIGLDYAFDQVTPAKWQRAMGCLTKGDKKITKAKAQQLCPHLKVTHATADAILLGWYSWKHWNR